jgi:autotransporter-associated beta strand protein
MSTKVENDTLRSFMSEKLTPLRMSKRTRQRPFLSLLSVLLAASAGLADDTATTAWNGSVSTAWTDASNWANGTPSGTKSALFNSTFANQPDYAPSSGGNVHGIWLATGVNQDVTITQSKSIKIMGDATLGNQANAGILLDDTANHSLTMRSSQQISLNTTTGFYVNNAGTLTLGGTASFNGNEKTLTLGGTNPSGQIVITRQIGRGGDTLSLVVDTAGTVTIGRDAGANPSYYTGGLTLNAGTLNLNHDRSVGTGTFTINGGTINNTTNAAITFFNNNLIVIGGDYTFTGTTNLNFGTGAVDLVGGMRTITASAGTLTLGGVVSNGGLTKAGAGNLILSGVNTYTNTTVSAGTLEITKTNCLYEASSVSIAADAKMYLNFNGTNTIKLLKLGGKVMQKGVYGASDLGGTAFFTAEGSGKLNVTDSGFPRGTIISIL